MDKATRNAIERATQQARKLLDEDFSSQLEGTFDVLRSGAIASRGGAHLSELQRSQRDKIIAAIEHKRSAGMAAAEAVADYVRDSAFTTLNRFVALKMLEARELVQECITKGEHSAGFREFCGMAPGVALLPDAAGYRLYIESLFDEFSTEIKVLFDRRDAASVLWPKRNTFESILEVLNAEELSAAWGEDETIGWFYQFFNSSDERRAMREASSAPLNGRELAIRNQFFTPRYVVEFLTDNTLGRIWYEMCGGRTELAQHCRYMVRLPNEAFKSRERKDPRDLRLIDPACGSGHFLLYAFGLLASIYEEAWRDAKVSDLPSKVTGNRLRDDYPDQAELRRAIPLLILRHNLHGVDIDPRCVQIAQLALWMCAQRAFRDFGIARSDRPEIRRANIVLAEPMPGEEELQKDFTSRLSDPVLADHFERLVDTMKLAGDLGTLLPVEAAMRKGAQSGKTGDLFAPTDECIRPALKRFAEEAATQQRTVRRLFADDALAGLGFLEMAEQTFDVVLMNPPFGDCTPSAKSLLFDMFGRERIDLGGCFISRFIQKLQAGGKLGVIANRTLLFAASLDQWRAERLSGVTAVADLGHGVLDALVETAAFTVGNERSESTVFIGALDSSAKDQHLATSILAVQAGDTSSIRAVADFRALFGAPFAYWAPTSLITTVARLRPAEAVGGIARQGLATCDNFRFLRLAEELPAGAAGWMPLTKGGEYQPFWAEVPLRVRWKDDGREVKAYIDALHGQWSRVIQSTSLYGIPGATYSGRTASSLSLRVLPRGSIFDKKGPFVGAASEGLSIQVAIGLIGLSYTSPYRFLIETAIGLRDATTSGSAARDYLPSMIQRLPWPDLSEGDWTAIESCTRSAIEASRELSASEESSQFWHEPLAWSSFPSLAALAAARLARWSHLQIRIYAAAEMLEKLSEATAGAVEESDKLAIAAVAGNSVFAYSRRHAEDVDSLQQLLDLPADQLIGRLASNGNTHSTIYKKGYWGDRSIELISHLWRIHPASLLEALKNAPASPRWIENTAWRIVSWAMASAVGRIHSDTFFVDTHNVVPPDIFATPEVDVRTRQPGARAILVDDPGHESDVAQLVEDAIATQFSPDILDELIRALTGGHGTSLRELIASSFFSRHLSDYSDYRRAAPVYWQLSTPSTRFSAWIYIHALTKDTLYNLQNDFVTKKLAHEERKLESIRRDCGPSPTGTQRKELAAQELFVEELRTFLDDLKRIVPLFSPVPDDGVIINFAPLWRLVPHQKAWQKELNGTWEALCRGDYDWAHLAMHLWPERVVPKCVTDRSLAIAHGLEDILWVEKADDRWMPRPTPTRPLDELVRERTSVAVKAALKSLLEAPVSKGNGGRGRGRRAANTAAEVGAR
jgi:hypothetical protein